MPAARAEETTKPSERTTLTNVPMHSFIPVHP